MDGHLIFLLLDNGQPSGEKNVKFCEGNPFVILARNGEMAHSVNINRKLYAIELYQIIVQKIYQTEVLFSAEYFRSGLRDGYSDSDHAVCRGRTEL